MDDFSPLNQLESKLLDAKRGSISTVEFVRYFWLSEIALPTANEVKPDGSGFSPILFDRHGTNMLAVFSAKERIGELANIAKFCMIMKGGEILRRVPKGFGLVVNPGFRVGFEISPSGIDEIVKEHG